jgi:hypothetical protein
METKSELKVPMIKSVGLAAAFFLAVMLIANFLPRATRSRAESWLTNIAHETSATLTFGPQLTDQNVKQRLQAQATTLSGRAEFHKAVMLYFISNYYSAILLAAICGGIAAATLVLVSKNGWTQAHPYAVATFLTASACATFFLAMPALFKQEENVSKNKLLYLKYVNLLHEMRTHALFNPLRQTNAAGSTNFIAYVDGEMAKANDIAVAFDPTKFPTFKNIAADAK